MAAKAWVCKKCGHENNPDEPGFNSSKCSACNTNRHLIIYVATAGAIGLIVIIVAITVILGMPKKKYMAKYKIAMTDNIISQEEQKQLDEIAKRYKITQQKIDEWIDEIKGPKPSGGPTPPPPVEEPPVEAKMHLQQGMNYVKSEDYGNAIKEFTLAIEKYSNYSEAYSSRGVAYIQQKSLIKRWTILKRQPK